MLGDAVEAVSPIMVFDPGGVQAETVSDPTDILYKILGEALPTGFARGSAVVREGQVFYCGDVIYAWKVTLDTGANSANYVGEEFLKKLPGIRRGPCHHYANLGDGKSRAYATGTVWLDIGLYNDDQKLSDPVLFNCLGSEIKPLVLGLSISGNVQWDR